jgi:DNA polymerase-3 subunit gamma/tau
MDYQVLYRKYRPSNFDELMGQDHIVRLLKNSVIENKLAHTYLFTGPRGTGKTSSARIFAKTINCENPKDGIPCGECASCQNFNSSPDIVEIDAASNTGVDNIRNIIEEVMIAPSFMKYKVYIMDEVHMLSKSAWNAFLKVLEEPPEYVVFILATTDVQNVPITVLSRCQRLDFRRIDRNKIVDNLKKICKNEGIKATDDALEEISYLSDGGMRDALSILDQLSKASDKIDIDVIKNNYGTVTVDEINELYNNILHNDIDTLVNSLNDIKLTGIDIKILINKMLDCYIDKAVDMKKRNLSTQAFNQIKKLIEALNDISGKLNYSSNGFLMLELELISFINDDETKLSSREISQIISREIIDNERQVDVNQFIDNSTHYNMCDEFINIRINNSFVNASKEYKQSCHELWNNFINEINDLKLKEFNLLVGKTIVQVASDNNILLVAKTESVKLVGNNKLFEIENKFNEINKSKYKLIFITEKEWKDLLSSFDKDKKYKLMNEDKYVNESADTVSLAESLFDDKIEVK